jgi:flagellar hook-associated protein 2
MGISLSPSTILSGQGINVSSVVQQIITSQSGELSVWQNEGTTLATQDGVLEGIENDLTNLQTAVAALADPSGALTAVAATSSNTAVLNVSTPGTNSTVPAGNYEVQVNGLASAGAVFSAPVAGGANTSFLTNGATSGDIKLQIGAGATATTQDIQITQGSNDTLTSLASYINTQSTANNWGVTANVITDATGSWLDVQSQNTGSTGAVAITSNTSTSLAFTSSGGTNATITVNGVPYASLSNTLSTPSIPGVTLTLSSTSSSPVEVSVGPNVNQITSDINNFVTAYNTVVSDINAQYQVDPTGGVPAPPLESDTSLRSLQSSILNDASYALPGATGSTTVNSGLINLASLGINMNNDGTLTVGTNAAGQTLAQIVAANPSAVLNFFQNGSGTGFANSFNTDLTNLTDPTIGPLNVDVTQNEATQQTLTTNISNFQTQLSGEQTQLTQQYDSVNASLQAYPLLLQEITETLGTLGSSTSSSGALVAGGPTLTSGL